MKRGHSIVYSWGVILIILATLAIGSHARSARFKPLPIPVAERWHECGGILHPEPKLRVERTPGGNPFADYAAWAIVIDVDDAKGDLRGPIAHEFAHLTVYREDGYAASYDGSRRFEIRHYLLRQCLGLEP